MATTKRNAMLNEEMRSRIDANRLVKRLQDHVLGDGILSESQIRAAGILLKKVIPDLATVTVAGDENNPLVTVSRVERVVLPLDAVRDQDGSHTTH